MRPIILRPKKLWAFALVAACALTLPLAAQIVTEAEREKSRLNYEKAKAGDFEAIRLHALGLMEGGVYPDFKPNPRGAVNYLEVVLQTYNGVNRAQLETNLVTYRRLANAFEADSASAERGEAAGLYAMAHRYNFSTSVGVRQDKRKALTLFQAAADKGHLAAHEELAKLLYYGDYPDKAKAILYMQKGEARGLKTAGYWLDQWGAPRSPELAQQKAAELSSSNVAARAFAAGSFSPNFWGTTQLNNVNRRAYTRAELIPALEQVKAGLIYFPKDAGYRAWGLPLGSFPADLQILKSASVFTGCILNPVSPRFVAGINLQDTASVDYEVWEYGNRKAIRVGCLTEHAGFRGPGLDRILYYLIDNKLVAVQANVSIYNAAVTVGSDVTCSAPVRSPANLVANERRGTSGWALSRQISLSRTPMSGIRYGDWFTFTRPGVVMHVFPKRWPNLTIEGTSSVAKCGTGTSEYLITTPQFNAALNLNGTRLPYLRMGRSGTMLEEEN